MTPLLMISAQRRVRSPQPCRAQKKNKMNIERGMHAVPPAMVARVLKNARRALNVNAPTLKSVTSISRRVV
jgi:hypothetical protein